MHAKYLCQKGIEIKEGESYSYKTCTTTLNNCSVPYATTDIPWEIFLKFLGLSMEKMYRLQELIRGKCF